MRGAVLMTRQAISPRLAIRIRLNMGSLLATFGRGPALQAGAAIWHAGTDVTIPSYSKTKQRQRLICRESAAYGEIFDAPLNPAAIRRPDACRRRGIRREQLAPQSDPVHTGRPARPYRDATNRAGDG